MGRPKKKVPDSAILGAGRPVEPEDASQAEPDDEETPVTAIATPKPAPKAAQMTAVSKAEAVRQALAAGMESPGDGVGFIKSNYGIDMEKQAFSSYKAQAKARDAKHSDAEPKGKPGRKPKAASVEGYLAPPPKPRAVGEEGDLIASLETLKPLIASYGADKVKRLVDLLG